MLIAFSIAIIGALLVCFLNKDMGEATVYGSGLILYVVGYFFIRNILKIDLIFPYFMLFTGFTIMTTNILLYGGQVDFIVIFFFLLFLATAHFYTSVLLIGYVLGMIGIVFVYLFPVSEQAD